jgi:hypothetical protein
MESTKHMTKVYIRSEIDFVELRTEPRPFQPDMQELEQQVQETINFFNEQSWKALPPLERSLPDQIEPGELYMQSPRADLAYATLQEFYVRQRERGESVDIRLNRDTGLPGYIYGELDRPGNVSDTEAALKTIRDLLDGYPLYATMLAGAVDDLFLIPVGFSTWNDGTKQFALRQITGRNEPIYGGFVVFTFDVEDRLVLISSALYPFEGDSLPALDEFPVSTEALRDLIQKSVPASLGEIGWIPEFDTEAFIARERYIFPFRGFAVDDSQGEDEDGFARFLSQREIPMPELSRYRPVVRVPFQDQAQRHWLVIIDLAEEVVISLEAYAARHPVNHTIFPTPADAWVAKQAFDANNQMAFNQLVQNRGLNRPIDLGGSNHTLATGDGVHLTGTRMADPGSPTLAWNSPEKFLGATVYFHLRNSQSIFATLLTVATMAKPSVPHANPLGNIAVFLDDATGSAEYQYAGRIIYFASGQVTISAAGVIETQVLEPGFDADVAMHELTHAVAYHYFEGLFESNNNEAHKLVWDAFNEGVAFFFPCTFFQEPTWSEFAYQMIAVNRNLSILPKIFGSSGFMDDPYGLKYGLGMWWARIFWQIRLRIPDFSILLLKAMASLATPQPQGISQAIDHLEQIRGAVGTIASVIHDKGRTHKERQIIADLFANLGITVH